MISVLSASLANNAGGSNFIGAKLFIMHSLSCEPVFAP